MSDISDILGGSFDATTVEPMGDFSPLPAGWYSMLIEAAEIKDTKAKTGKYLKLTLLVTEGKFKNRKVFDQVNLVNPSSQTVEIGKRKLAGLALALGLTKIEDTSVLINGLVRAKLEIEAAHDNYDVSNNVKAYKSPNGAAPVVEKPVAAAKPVVATAEPAKAGGVLPWMKK